MRYEDGYAIRHALPTDERTAKTMIGVGGSVLLLDVLYRVGVSGDGERDEEEAARAYLDEHGRWPDE